MPYTVDWDEALPTSASAANLIWQYIQDNLIAVRERIDDVFGTTAALVSIANADPYRIGKIKMTADADSTIIPGTGSWGVRNNADNAYNLRIYDDGDGEIRGTFDIAKSASVGVQTISTSGASLSIDMTLGNAIRLSLGHSITTLNLNNLKTGCFYTFEISQTGAGNFTIAWPASARWPSGSAPTITPTTGRTSLVSFFYNGTNLIGVTSGLNYTL